MPKATRVLVRESSLNTEFFKEFISVVGIIISIVILVDFFLPYKITIEKKVVTEVEYIYTSSKYSSGKKPIYYIQSEIGNVQIPYSLYFDIEEGKTVAMITTQFIHKPISFLYNGYTYTMSFFYFYLAFILFFLSILGFKSKSKNDWTVLFYPFILLTLLFMFL